MRDRNQTSRRQLLTVIGGVGVTSLTGCSNTPSTEDNVERTDTTQNDTPTDNTKTPATTEKSESTQNVEVESISNWHQFRGDASRLGIAPSEAGPDAGATIAWEFTVDTLIEEFPMVVPAEISSPVVVGKLVVLAFKLRLWDNEEDRRTRRAYVVGLDGSTGTIRWQHQWELSYLRTGGPSPVVHDGKILHTVVKGDETTLVFIDPASGGLTDEVSITGRPSSVTAGPDRLYLMGLDSLRAINPANMSELWRHEKGSLYNPVSVADGRVLLSKGYKITALDGATGKRQWQTTYEFPGNIAYSGGATPFATPTVVGDSAYVAGGLNTVLQRGEAGLVAFDPETGDEQWRFKPPVNDKIAEDDSDDTVAGSGVYGYPLRLGDTVYVTGMQTNLLKGASHVDKPRLYALDASTGEITDETEMWPTFAPVAAGKTLFLPGGRQIRIVSDFKNSPATVDRKPLFERSPAVGHGQVFVPIRDGLVALTS